MTNPTLPLVKAPERPTIGCHGLLYRQVLLANGHTPSSIRHRLCSGEWRRLFDGVYLDMAQPPEVQQHAYMVGALARCGPGSVIGGETAAAWHGFDSTKGWGSSPLVMVQPREQRVPQLEGITFRRTRTLDQSQIVSMRTPLGSIAVTSRARTLIDVMANIDLVEGERVLESMLRGADPRRPDVWREADLAELQRLVSEHPRQPGAHQVRLLLSLRPEGCRPTGSIAETSTVQALRGAGFTNVVRQPLVIAPDEHNNPRQHFLDLFLPDYVLDVEVDGDEHLDRKRRSADVLRDRRLSRAMGILRFSAADALYNPQRIVDTVRDEIQRMAHDQRTLQQMSHRLVGGELRFTIEPSAA